LYDDVTDAAESSFKKNYFSQVHDVSVDLYCGGGQV